MLVGLRQRRNPHGRSVWGQLAGEACMGLQGYSGPWLAISTPVTRARIITHIVARCTPRIQNEFGRPLPASLGMKIHDNRIDVLKKRKKKKEKRTPPSSRANTYTFLCYVLHTRNCDSAKFARGSFGKLRERIIFYVDQGWATGQLQI